MILILILIYRKQTQTERRMVDICQGNKSKNEVLSESIELYKEMFVKTRLEFQKLMNVG